MPNEYYEIRVLVRHPGLGREALISSFGEEPHNSGNLGDQWAKYSFWSMTEAVSGQRTFSSGISATLDWLEKKAKAVAEVCQTGGTVEVILQLPGDRNIGDSLSATLLSRAGALGIAIGIEVFPVMNSAPK